MFLFDQPGSAEGKQEPSLTRIALRTGLIYWICSVLWILFSDRVLAALVQDADTITRIQMYKGWAFVTVTALLIYVLLLRPLKRWEAEARTRRDLLKALSESEARFRLLAEGLPHLVWTCVADGRCDYLSPQWEEFTGVPAAGHLGKAWLEQIHPDDREALERKWRAATGSGATYHDEYRILGKDGQYRWFQVRALPIHDGAGRVVKWFGVNTDINLRKETEEKLRAAQGRLTSALEAGGIGTWELDLKSDLATWDDALVKLFGRPAGRAPGHSYQEFMADVHAEDQEKVLGVKEAALANGRFDVQFRYLRPDGRLLSLASRGCLVRDPEGQPLRIVGATVDVTETVRLEEQLRQSQKMETVGQLAGGVAHDFNNLLTVIAGYGHLLLQSYAQNDPRRSHATNILKAGERASGLTRQLLAFSRKQVLEPKVLDLNHVVRNTEKMLARLIGEDIRFQTRLDEGLGAIRVDPSQIDQVILNLAVNARDAMPQGGQLSIETQQVRLDEAFCRLHDGASPGQYALLSISDTGHGMTPEVKARIFEPFFTTKGLSKGTGLGLATVYGIVRQSDGVIEVRSEPGQGASFRLYFPIVEGRPEHAEDEAPQERMEGRETILLVEDEENVREICRLTLESHGYTVVAAANGQDALSAAGRHPGKIDLLLTDVVMPSMSGRQLAEEMQKRHAGLKIVYMSGYLDDAVIRHGVSEAHVNFVNKPFAPSMMVRKVREVLGGEA
ncbi:MAG: PAS domain-containing protein [Planctomycetota bacterium]|nr:PAS domain-containing protein [Planctomycetota bacterium]